VTTYDVPSAYPAEVVDVGALLVDASPSGLAAHSTGATRLLQEADVAMYRAKEAGRGRVEIFDERLRVAVVERLELENALHRAAAAGDFTMHYQPIVRMTTGEVVGVDALIRWQRGPVIAPPLTFIKVAEEVGLVGQLGRFALDAACEQLGAWRSSGAVDEDFFVTVNLSACSCPTPSPSRRSAPRPRRPAYRRGG
jgi:predicted signal transduction protein with EAL and GGDEF domain